VVTCRNTYRVSRERASKIVSGLSLNRLSAKILLITVAYVIVARLGQEIVVTRVTPVCPASGLALAALLLGGYRMWPAIMLGSVLVNTLWGFDTHRAASSAMAIAGMATGATLEAFTGAYLLREYSSDIRSLHRATDVFKFLVLGGVTSPIIAASFGTSSLALFHSLPWQDYGMTWLTWWMGDMAGILIVTPLILAWSNKEQTAWNPKRFFEAGILFFVILIVEKITFQDNYSLQYMFIPCLVWAAFRFRRERRYERRGVYSGNCCVGNDSRNWPVHPGHTQRIVADAAGVHGCYSDDISDPDFCFVRTPQAQSGADGCANSGG
jgi:integral membrane sensor domain MASE1